MTVSSTLREPEVETPGIVFPTGFTTVGTGNRVNPDPRGPAVEQVQRLNLIPGQFQGNATGSGGTQRLFEEIDGTVFYQPAADVGIIDWTRPFINDVDATTSGNQVQFIVDTNDPDSGVSRVVVLYRSGATTWTSVDLAQQGTPATWIGGGLFGAVTPPLDYFVFSVNDYGVTSVSTFKGGLYETQDDHPRARRSSRINGTPDECPECIRHRSKLTGPEQPSPWTGRPSHCLSPSVPMNRMRSSSPTARRCASSSMRRNCPDGANGVPIRPRRVVPQLFAFAARSRSSSSAEPSWRRRRRYRRLSSRHSSHVYAGCLLRRGPGSR